MRHKWWYWKGISSIRQTTGSLGNGLSSSKGYLANVAYFKCHRTRSVERQSCILMDHYTGTNKYDSMNHLKYIGFVQTLKTLFSRTFQDLQRPNSRVFQDSKMHFQGLSRIHSIHKHGCMRSKVHIPNQFSMLNNSISKIRIDQRGDKMHTMYYNESFL